MQEKINLIGADSDEQLLADIIAATKAVTEEPEEAKQFSAEEVDLPLALPIKPHQIAPIELRKYRRKGNIEGDRFYDGLKYKKVNGKTRVRGPLGRYDGKTRPVEILAIIDGVPTIVTEKLLIRKQSKPSKSWLARQKKAA